MDLDKQKLLELYPDYTSVLGPYKRKDDRQHIVLNNSNAPKGTKGKTKTISYPKALVESNTGIRLEENETIDHHDREFNNNHSDNLKIKDRSQHASEDALRVNVLPVYCSICGCDFIPTKSQLSNHGRTNSGPFCSKNCLNLFKRLDIETKRNVPKSIINKSYYRVSK